MHTNAKLQSTSLLLIALMYLAIVTFQPSLNLLPTNIGWFVDRQRILELLLLFLALINTFLIGYLGQNVYPISKPIQIGFLYFLVFAFFSAFLAYSPRHALTELTTFSALSYFCLIIANQYRDQKNLLIKYLTYALWASILLYMLSFYTGFITALVVNKPLAWPHPFRGFTNIRSFNQYQLWLLGIVLLPFLMFSLKKKVRIFLHIALVGWWVLLFYSASRGVLISWLIGIFFTAFAYQAQALPFLRLQLIHIITGFISYQLLFKLLPTTNDSQLVTSTIVRQTTNDRIALWDQAIRLIESNPIFGVGPMHYAWYNKTNAHPHNSVLQLAAEWGLPATIILLSIAAYGFYHWFKKFNSKQLQKMSKTDKNLSIILFFTIITNTAYSMVDGVIVTPISQVLMFTMIGLMLGQYISSENLTTYKSKTRHWIAGIFIAILAWSIYPEIKQGFSGEKQGFSMGYTAKGPRFWFEAK